MKAHRKLNYFAYIIANKLELTNINILYKTKKGKVHTLR